MLAPMKVEERGHEYWLQNFDSDPSLKGTEWEGYDEQEFIRFVKREGDKYPGNVGTHPGTLLQELYRVAIDRLQFLQEQEPCAENIQLIDLARESIWLLEQRNARRKGRVLRRAFDGAVRMDIENEPFCQKCGHIRCEEHK